MTIKTKLLKFQHAGITVKNLEKSLEFYSNKLGFEVLSKQNVTDKYIFDVVAVPQTKLIKIAFINIPNDDLMIELLEYEGSERHSGSARPSDYGTGHICLRVHGLLDLHKELLTKGVKFRSDKPIDVTSGRHKGGKIIYCEDPDGYLIELMELVEE